MSLPSVDFLNAPRGHVFKEATFRPGPEWVLMAERLDWRHRRLRLWQQPVQGSILLYPWETCPAGWHPVAFIHEIGPSGASLCARDEDALFEELRFRARELWIRLFYRVGWRLVRWLAWITFADIPPGSHIKGAIRDLWARRNYRDRELA